MTEKIRLTLIHDDKEFSCEISSDSITLNGETYDWLKRAFIGIGYHPYVVDKFFDEEAKE